MNRNAVRIRGFSLVELVIVIVILGVIAAIAIPRISSGSRNAGDAALRANLQSIRNSIDWYYSEHNNTFPAAGSDNGTTFVEQLTMYSKADGTTSTDKDSSYPFGPYLRGKFPKLSVGAKAGNASVYVVTSTTPLAASPGEDAGWVYNSTTGQIIANCADLEKGSDNISYNQY